MAATFGDGNAIFQFLNKQLSVRRSRSRRRDKMKKKEKEEAADKNRRK